MLALKQAYKPLEAPNVILRRIMGLPELRHYKRATEYYVKKGFCSFRICKGSLARLVHSHTFATIERGRLLALKKRLIANGILCQSDNNYLFIKDYDFTSASTAACIIAGNSRDDSVWMS